MRRLLRILKWHMLRVVSAGRLRACGFGASEPAGPVGD